MWAIDKGKCVNVMFGKHMGVETWILTNVSSVDPEEHLQCNLSFLGYNNETTNPLHHKSRAREAQGIYIPVPKARTY